MLILLMLFCCEYFSYAQTDGTPADTSTPEAFIATWAWALSGLVQTIAGYLVPLFPPLNNWIQSKTLKVVIMGVPFLILFFTKAMGVTDILKIVPLLVQAITSGIGIYTVGKQISPALENTKLK